MGKHAPLVASIALVLGCGSTGPSKKDVPVGAPSDAAADGGGSVVIEAGDDGTEANPEAGGPGGPNPDAEGPDAVNPDAGASESGCDPALALPAGRSCTGDAPAPDTACTSDSMCGASGRCGDGQDSTSVCCGATNACCQTDSDCCSSLAGLAGCIQGTCSSYRNGCGCDADCTGGAVCIAGNCLTPSGTACTDNLECASGSCNAVCAQGHAQYSYAGDPCRSTADCANGTCSASQCVRLPEGGSCHADADCADGVCTAGACRCQPGGAQALTDPYNNGCCSDWVVNTGTLICAATTGTPCSATTPDCFGGPCNAGRCSCVGVGGFCSGNQDCCAGASTCVSGRCQ